MLKKITFSIVLPQFFPLTVVFFLITFSTILSTGGKEYFISEKGDDQNDGSATKPLLTITHALKQVGPGDIISVDAGTYAETINISKSGKPDAPLVLRAKPGKEHQAVITYPSPIPKVSYGLIALQGSVKYVVVEGFKIIGSLHRKDRPPESPFISETGIALANGAGEGIIIRNNIILSHLHCGIKEYGHGGSRFLIEDNIIFDNGQGGRATDHGMYIPASEVIIRGNICYSNAAWGIHLYLYPKKVLVTRNISYGNWGGIVMSGSEGQFYHNVSCYNRAEGFAFFRGGSKKNIVRNNIFAFNGSKQIAIHGESPTFKCGDPLDNVCDYNCLFPAETAVVSWCEKIVHPEQFRGVHDLLKDPCFINGEGRDFRLKRDSPCRNKGVNLGFTYYGAGPDIGVFEMGSDEKLWGKKEGDKGFKINWEIEGLAPEK